MITLKQKINSISELDPLLLNMERIHALDLKIHVSSDNNGNIALGNETIKEQSNTNNVQEDIEKRKKEFRNKLSNICSKGPKKQKNVERFIHELFTDTMETESWVNEKENIIHQYNQSVNQMGDQPLSHYSLNLEQIEIADINFYRDIGPLSRQLIIDKYNIYSYNYIHSR